MRMDCTLMNLLIINGRRGLRSYNLSGLLLYIILPAIVIVLCTVLVALGYQLGRISIGEKQHVNHWVSSFEQGRESIQRISQQTSDDLNALALSLGQMEARSLRLDALGSRLAKIAGLGEDEFDFSSEPPIGGPAEPVAILSRLPGLLERFTDLQRQIDDRQHKFRVLEFIMMDRELMRQALPEGRPIKKGWLSSKYGYRIDPFTGERSWHAGADFAGKYGSDVISVASGIVTYSGHKSSYGQLIEISHSDGYMTRYAHNSENLVSVGDVVERGDVIARMGSSGRSTGSHVHFEVLHEGKVLNPKKYINRVSKH